MTQLQSSENAGKDCGTHAAAAPGGTVAKDSSNACAALGIGILVVIARRFVPLLVIALAMYGLHEHIEYSGWVLFAGLLAILY